MPQNLRDRRTCHPKEPSSTDAQVTKCVLTLRDVPGKGSKMSQNGCPSQGTKKKESKSPPRSGECGRPGWHIRYGLVGNIPNPLSGGRQTDNNGWWHKAAVAANAINTHRRHITGIRSPSPCPSIMYYRCTHTHTHTFIPTYYMRMYNAWTWSWACLWRT